MKVLIKRNYDSIVKRGLISPDTSVFKFIDKIYEEIGELEEAVNEMSETNNIKQIHFDNINEELADVILTCLNMAKHFDIDIEAELKKKIEVNFKRCNTTKNKS